MKFGLFLNGQSLPGEPLNQRIAESLEQTRAAREAGFDLVCAGQHYLSAPYQMPALFPFLARIAAEAGEMQVGATVTLLPIHNPVYLAETVATMDAICNGRFVFGVGLGYRDEEFTSFGVKRGEQAPRLVECLRAIKLLWTEDEVEFHGKFYQIPKVRPTTRPIQKPHPPIWLAANSDIGVKRAARGGYPWLINPHAAIPTISRQLALYLQTVSESGRQVPSDQPLMRESYLANTRAKAYQESRPYLEGKYKAYAAWGQDRALPGNETFQVAFDKLARDRFIVGNPDSVVEELKRYQDILGVNYLVLRLQWPGLPHQKAMEEIQLLGRYVIPAFKQ